jgi:hypothetical protein
MALTKTDSYEKLLEVVERAAWREFDRAPVIDVMGDLSDPGFDTHVHNTFQDTVIFQDEFSDKMYEASYVLMGDQVVFGQMHEVAEMYVEKRMSEVGLEYKKSVKSENSDPEISGPIVMKNAAQRIAYAPVLVPGEKDSDGEIISAEKIEQVAHGWMESYRNVDLMHTLNNTGFPVESYILPMEMEVEAYGQKMKLPVGTWILASKLSEDAWAGVESGILTGYSVMGIKKAQLDMATKSEDGAIDEAAFKRTLLADLGPDWVAAFVSVVDHPAVPKAKFFALKSKEFSEEEDTTVIDSTATEPVKFLTKVGKALGITKDTTDDDKVAEDVALDVAEKAGRRYSDKTYDSLKKAFESLSALIMEAEAERQPVDKSAAELSEGPVTDMDDTQLKAIIAEAVKSAVEPLVERLDEIEKASKAEVPEVEATEVVEELAVEKAADVVEELAADDEAAPVEVVEKAEETPVVEEVIEDVVDTAVKAEEEAAPVVEPVVEKAAEVVAPSEEEIAAEAALKAAAEEAAAEDASFKAELVDRLEQLEKRLGRVATGSKALANDGGGAVVEETPLAYNRDAFGRRVK